MTNSGWIGDGERVATMFDHGKYTMTEAINISGEYK